MRGLALLLPVLSCVFALVAYLAGGGLWMVLGAFFVAGPLVAVLLGVFLTGRTHAKSGDEVQKLKRRG